MEYYFYIPLETPSKKNSRITLKNGKTIPSEKYRNWHKSASLYLSTQKRPKEPLEKNLSITIVFEHGDKKRRDSDNQTSSILDILQDTNILKDDNWQIVNRLEILNFYNKDKPKCTINIKEIKPINTK